MSLATKIHSPGAKLRQSAYAVDPLFIERWSPRAFTGESIDEPQLFTAFEAAHWAPSANNYQPWRFVYARRESARFDAFVGLLTARNREWAHKASAIVYFISDKIVETPEKQGPSHSHAFDTGAAWSNFAHQLHLLGYATRAMGGFDRDAAPEVLNVSDRFHIHVAVAVGRPDHPDTLPESFRDREVPNARRPLQAFVFEDQFAEGL